LEKLVVFKVLQKGESKFMFAVLGSVALTRQSLITSLKKLTIEMQMLVIREQKKLCVKAFAMIEKCS
jgi:hypothetical protein